MKIMGLIAAPFAPFDKDGNVNLGIVEDLADHYTQLGVAGVFVNGTTGEGLSLTIDERIALAEEWTTYARDDFKVIIHVGHNSIKAARQLAAHAQHVGAHAIGAMGPCFFRPINLDEFVGYCASIAEAGPTLPFYYYHIPAMTGVHFKMIDFLQAATARIPTLTGIKFTSEDLMDYRRCLTAQDSRFDILFGRDEILLAGLALGAQGAVGSTYNYAAPLYHQMMQAFRTGDLNVARYWQDRAIEIVNLLRLPSAAELAVNKWIMSYCSGIECGPVRSPVANLTQAQKDSINSQIDRFAEIDMIRKDRPLQPQAQAR